jgi:integrase
MPNLTEPLLASAKPAATRREIPDSKVTGLYFIVQPSGHKSWACRYRASGKSVKHTLGSYPAMTLRVARLKARETIAAAGLGKDPATAKREAKLAAKVGETTFATVADAFVRQHGARFAWKTEAARLLNRDVLPALGSFPVDDPTRAKEMRVKVRALMRAITERGAPIVANRCLVIAKRVLNWAVEEEIIDTNPLAQLKRPTKENARERVLSESELRLVWRAFERTAFPYGPIGKLLMLTAARRGEVASLPWREIDLKSATWTLPAERAKNGRACTIPLSEPAVAIIEALPRFAGSDFLFAARVSATTWNGVFSRIKLELDDLIAADNGEAIQPWTIHDIHRSVATHLQKLGIRWEIVEAILNHVGVSRGGVAGVYQHHTFADEKRKALALWATRLQMIVEGTIVEGGEPVSNVIALKDRVTA